MPFYYESKAEATSAAEKYAPYWDHHVELHECNGWAIVLRPLTNDVFKYPLDDLLNHVILDLSNCARVFRRPPGYRAPVKVYEAKYGPRETKAVPPPPPRAPGPPPPSPPTIAPGTPPGVPLAAPTAQPKPTAAAAPPPPPPPVRR